MTASQPPNTSSSRSHSRPNGRSKHHHPVAAGVNAPNSRHPGSGRATAMKNAPDTKTDMTATAPKAAAGAIADALTSQGFDIRDPNQPGSSFLQITNAPGALSELTIYDSGHIDWEYRSRDGSQSNPSVLAAMTLRILSTDPGTSSPVPVARDPRMTLKGQVGRALADQGMQVRLDVLDEDEQLFEVYAEITITNPASPDRGTIRIADDGPLWWRCRIRDPEDPDSGGLDLDEITGAIARALTAASGTGQSTRTAPMPTPLVIGMVST